MLRLLEVKISYRRKSRKTKEKGKKKERKTSRHRAWTLAVQPALRCQRPSPAQKATGEGKTSVSGL